MNCETIYHYTTVSGLIGIVTHREIWASDCQFLNDGTELSYAEDIFRKEVQKLNLPPLTNGGYLIAGPSIWLFRMFIACFCEDGDLLSQWRGYGADQGYAIGFDTEILRSLNIGEVSPVQYGIVNPSEYFKQELDDANHISGHPGVSEWYASERLLPRLARVKHPGFAEEREWRILKQVPFYDLSSQEVNTQFRPSPMGPIAYLVLPFPPDCLREIVIGPGSHTETHKAAIKNLLRINNLPSVNVRISNVPFRR